jgi:signal transduction histidine kinase
MPAPSPLDPEDARTDVSDASPAVARGLVDHLLERMTDAFIALDRDWRVVYMNSAAMGLNAEPRPDVIGRLHWEEWPLTVGSEVERQYRLAMETQRPVHFEHHYETSGQDFWHAIHAYPDANGLSIFYRDITEQRRSDELAKLLATAGARFASTLDRRSTMEIVAGMALPRLGQWSCVYLVDERWTVTDVRVGAIDQERGQALRDLVSRLPLSATDQRLPFIRAMHTGKPELLTDVDADFRRALGGDGLDASFASLAPRSLLCVPLIARGRTIGGITFGTSRGSRALDAGDVLAASEIAVPAALALDNAQLFEAESRARQDAEDANRSKLDFLRAMSHEFRTPLNAIGGYAQLLLMGLRGDLNAQQRSDVERIDRNHVHVTNLINDILSFTRVEAGRVEFNCKRVQVAHLFRELEGFIAPQFGDGVRPALTIHTPDAEIAVWADPAKTNQILVNLMTNALKHTPRGTEIDVACERHGDGDVRIHVRDRGPGITAEQQESIFIPFVQLGRALNRPVEGLGLGLAIARDLARGMKGDVTLVSESGHGCVFTLRLPAP